MPINVRRSVHSIRKANVYESRNKTWGFVACWTVVSWNCRYVFSVEIWRMVEIEEQVRSSLEIYIV